MNAFSFMVFDQTYRSYHRFDTEKNARSWIDLRLDVDSVLDYDDFILLKCERLDT